MAQAGSRVGFVTGGCWCVDNNKVIDFWPEEDQAVAVRSVQRRGGGSACNFAIDMRKLDPDMPVETIGLVGDDENGRFLRSEAARFGICTDQLHVTADARTHLTDAYTSLRSGRRTHIGDEGTSGLLNPGHFDFAATSGRILHLGLPGAHRTMDAVWEADANGWVAVLRAAREAGLRTNLELVTVARERIAALVLPCLPLLDTLVVNDSEIGALANIETTRDGATDEAACLVGAREVMARGSMALVAVHYARGAIALSRDGDVVRKPAVAVPPELVKGANGAGDAFAAGFLRILHDDGTLEDALTLAHAAAAACLRDVTTSDSVASRQQCLDLAQSWGWRT